MTWPCRLWELILACIWVEEARPGMLLYLWRVRSYVIAKVQVIFIVIVSRWRNEHIIVKIVLLILLVELLVRLFLRNFRLFTINGRIEWHFKVMIL